MKKINWQFFTHKNIFIIYSIIAIVTFSFFVGFGVKEKYDERKANTIDEDVKTIPEKDIYDIFEEVFNNNNSFSSVASLEKDVDDFNDLSMQEKTNIAYWDYNFSGHSNYDGIKLCKKDIIKYIKGAYKTPFELGDKNVYSTDTNLNNIPIFLYNKKDECYYSNDEFQKALNKKDDSISILPTEFTILSVERNDNIYKVTAVRRWEIMGTDMVMLHYLSVFDKFSNAFNNKDPLFVIPSNVNDYYQYYLNNFNKYKNKMARYIYTFEKVKDDYLLVSFEFEDR